MIFWGVVLVLSLLALILCGRADFHFGGVVSLILTIFSVAMLLTSFVEITPTNMELISSVALFLGIIGGVMMFFRNFRLIGGIIMVIALGLIVRATTDDFFTGETWHFLLS